MTWQRLKALLLPLLWTLLLVFILAEAGTWPGITEAPIVVVSILLLALLAVAWQYVRRRGHAQWHRTPLDIALPLWLMAFAISTAANLTMRAYIAVGLWFAGLYILIWYISYDLLSNNLLSSDQLLDVFFWAAAFVLLSVVPDVFVSHLSRVSGLLQNPNILGSFLLLLIVLAASRIRGVNGKYSIRYILLIAIAAVVLLLTGSRGGIFGLCAGLAFIIFLRADLRRRIIIAAIGIVLGLALLGIRGDSGRLQIYERAGMILSSHWLTGQGLFTFRTGEPSYAILMRLRPDGQNIHAHDIWLQITVELGVIGLLALALTVIQFARIPLSNTRQRWYLAAMFGLFAQELVDFTIMTPSIALSAIGILAMAAMADPGKEIRIRWPIWLLIGLALVLILAGLVVQHVPNFML